MKGAILAWAAIVVLVSPETACTYWPPQDLSPQQLLTADHPAALLVVRHDSSIVVLRKPEVSGDSLTGLNDEDTRVAIPLSDVASVAERKVDSGRTTALVLLGVGVTAFVVWAAIGLHDLAVNSN